MKRFMSVLGQLLVIALCLITPTTLWAAAGKVVIASGDVFAIDVQDQRRELQRRADVFEGDTLFTGANSQLQLRFEDNAILALRANSQLRISEYHGASEAHSEQVLMDLISGGFRTISGSFGKSERDAYQVRTPNASIGIRGTHYEAVFQLDTLILGVYEGGISVRNEQGELDLGLDSGFVFAEVQANSTPRGLLNPPDILNQPSTQPGQQDDAESDDEEGSDDSDDSDEQADETGPSDAPAATDPDVANSGADNLNISALEDVLNDNAGQLKGDPRLTDDEEIALANSDQTGFLVFASGSLNDTANTPSDELATLNVIFSLAAAVSGQNTFYGVFSDESEDTLVPLDSVDPTSDTAVGIIKTEGLTQTTLERFTLSNGDVVEWGVWNASDSDPAQTYHNSASGAQTGTIDRPFYYVLAEPTSAQLTAGRSFSGSCVSGCFNANLPTGTNFTGTLNVGLSEDSLVAEGGFTFTEPNQNQWSINYGGVIFGAQMAGFISDDSFYNVSNGGSYELSGGVYGIFSGPDDELVFVGGVNAGFDASELTEDDAQSVTTDELYGVYVLEEGAN